MGKQAKQFERLPEWGEFVEVFAEVKFWNRAQDLDEEEVWYTDRLFRHCNRLLFNEHRFGRLIGATYRLEGEIVQNSSFDDHGCHFVPKRRIFVGKVAIAWNKIIEVLPEDIVVALPRRLPYTGGDSWDAYGRKAQREMMKNVPRDEKGRWLAE